MFEIFLIMTWHVRGDGVNFTDNMMTSGMQGSKTVQQGMTSLMDGTKERPLKEILYNYMFSQKLILLESYIWLIPSFGSHIYFVNNLWVKWFSWWYGLGTPSSGHMNLRWHISLHAWFCGHTFFNISYLRHIFQTLLLQVYSIPHFLVAYFIFWSHIFFNATFHGHIF